MGDDSFVVHLDLSLFRCTASPDRAILRGLLDQGEGLPIRVFLHGDSIAPPAALVPCRLTGRTADFDSANLGSNPSEEAINGGDRQGRLSGRPLLVWSVVINRA